MDMVSNWVYMPKAWHDFMGSTVYGEKANLTTFLKALHDYCYNNDLYVHMSGETYIKSEKDDLYNLIFCNSITNKDLEKHVRYILQHVVPENDGTFTTMWDVMENCSPDEDITLLDYQKRTGLKMYDEHTEDVSENDNIDIEEWYLEAVRARDDDGSEEFFSENLLETLDIKGHDDENSNLPYQLPGNLKVKYVAFAYNWWVPKAPVKISGFAAPAYLSNELCNFLCLPDGSRLARTEVTRLMIYYIKDHDLEDPENRRRIIVDSKLETLVGTVEERKKHMLTRKDELVAAGKPDRAEKLDVSGDLTYFNLQVNLNRHFLKEKPPVDESGWKDVLQDIRQYSRVAERRDVALSKRKRDDDATQDDDSDSISIFKRVKDYMYSLFD